MQYEIRIDSRAALAKLERIPEFVSKEIRSRFRTLGQALRNELRLQIPRETGRARRAIFSKFDRRREKNDIALLVGGNVGKAPHLKIIERGGRIRPKTAQFLAVPIGPAANRHGGAKFQAKDLKANPQAYGYVRTWVHDDVVMGERASGDVEPLFALKREVIFPRAGARGPIRTFRDRNEARIKREVESAVIAGLHAGAGAGGGGGE